MQFKRKAARMRVVRPVLTLVRSITLLAVMAAALVPVHAQTASPAPSPSPDGGFCPVFPFIVERLDSAGTRWRVALQTYVEASVASGTVALYDGDRRYDIPFHRAKVADLRQPSIIPTPIVVAFGAPVHIDAAVVTALGDPPEPCESVYAPYNSAIKGSGGGFDPYPGRGQLVARLRRAAASAPAIAAPAPVDEPLPASCQHPTIPAMTINPVAPDMPPMAEVQLRSGVVMVLVTLGPDDRIIAARVEATSSSIFNASALAATRASRFRSETFRCRKAYASYFFSVDYR